MRIRFLLVVFIGFFLEIQLIGQVSFGEVTNINEGWKFKNKELVDEFNSKLNTDNWNTVNLPHDWSVESNHSPNLASCTGYLPGGIGWYKKSILIPVSDSGKLLFLYFGGVYCNSEVWINDHLLGKRPNGYISFMYEMTRYINYGSENTILVKVDHSKSADSRWYTGSGIYRDVYLVKSGPVHIDQWGVACSSENITQKQAVISVKTTIRNSTQKPVTVTVLEKINLKGDSRIVATVKKQIKINAYTTETTNQKLQVRLPLLWSLSNPNLYEVQISILDNQKEIDHTTVQAGIRSVVFDPAKGFSLNGQSLKLKGVCLHHDAGALGSAVPKQVWERRLKELKNLGCNAIRTSHNPQDDCVYDICDEIGLLVMDEAFDEWEFPKKKWLEGWNQGVPRYDGYAEYFNEWGEKDLTDMVMKHKNHPSIIMWSIGNEVDYPNDPYSHPILDKESIGQKAVIGYKPNQPDANRLGVIAKKLVRCVKGVDTSRPVTGALAGVVMSNYTDYPFMLDVAGYNYTENRYKQDHGKYPKRILFGSENRHEVEAWNSVKNNDYIAGQFLWTGIDYLGEAGPWPSRGFGSGLLNLAGFKKPLAYYRQSLWSEKPMVYIATMHGRKNNLLYDLEENWNYKEGQKAKVACFTNCEKVVLKLNGEKIESTPSIDSETGGQLWEIPFKSGTLTATGYNHEKEVSSYQLITSGRAESISCKADKETFNGKGDVAQIELRLLDKDGNPVFLCDDEINCRIDGPARLLGLENGNMSEMISHKTGKLRVFHGRLIAYIESTAFEGKINIEFSSIWLKPEKVTLDVK